MKRTFKNPEKHTLKEMNKILQDLKMEISAIKKTHVERILEINNLGIQTGTTKPSFTNRIHETEEKNLR